jgi:hypothetical protein
MGLINKSYKLTLNQLVSVDEARTRTRNSSAVREARAWMGA